MKLGDKFVWVDEMDSTVDNEVLVYLGKDDVHYFALDGSGINVWVGLDDDELDWVKPLVTGE